MRFVVVVLALLLAAPALAGPAAIIGRASVIDGDTIEIHGQRIRLAGIDAPEAAQLCTSAEAAPWRCGQAAALALADFLGRATLACTVIGQDQYGRALAHCLQGRVEINAWLVANGWAVRYFDDGRRYLRLEREAATESRGIWSGSFIRPKDWRKQHQ